MPPEKAQKGTSQVAMNMPSAQITVKKYHFSPTK